LSPLHARWADAARLVAENRDVLDARPGDGDENVTPRPLRERGWEPFLSSLEEAQVAELEVAGHAAQWSADAPASLAALVKAAREVCALPSLSSGPRSEVADRGPRKLETPRKRAQVDAFASLVLPLAANAARVVDVGSGHGHLTRAIAERIALPVVGLERDVALAERARGLPSAASLDLDFAVTDVLRDGLALAPGDCVIGLHVCGELGDAIVESVAAANASGTQGPHGTRDAHGTQGRGVGVGVAIIGCCLQKRRAPSRRPLCDAPGLSGALDLPRRLLGLSNLTARDDGVEATRAQNLAGRERRLALHRLLSIAGVGSADPGVDGGAGAALRLGAEIEGLNRRASRLDLPLLVERAFALRRLPAPSAAAIEAAAAWAAVQHGRARRLSLPRALLARVLEVFVLLDRALYLERHGLAVTVGEAFPAAVSARNLAIVAGPAARMRGRPGGANEGRPGGAHPDHGAPGHVGLI
jgi:SAM-dependent methyltransferase